MYFPRSVTGEQGNQFYAGDVTSDPWINNILVITIELGSCLGYKAKKW